jgi:hypothetical protein
LTWELLVIGHDRDNITRGHGGPQDPDRLHTPRRSPRS